MNRPPSIVTFERLYLGSIVVGLANTLLGWNARQALLTANPAVRANPELAGTLAWLMPATAVIGLLISLLLWFFVARQGSIVAKWVVTVFAGLGVLAALGGLVTLLSGRSPDMLGSLLGLLATALSVAAAAMLFRDDARAWFGEAPELPEEPLA